MTTTPPERFATGGLVPARARVPVDLNADETVWPASALDDFISRDGDLEGTDPAPLEQRDLTPIIREQERLVAQVLEVTDTAEPDPVTWADVQTIARLAENGMAIQADEHAVELRAAWLRGYEAAAAAAGAIHNGKSYDATILINPYPETTPASAQTVIDIYGEPLTWHQLPAYVATLHAKIRALAEVQS
jgi:hypothetical protein